VLRKQILMSSSSTHLPTPEGPGSVSGAPNLPDGFTDTFTSRYIDTAEVRLHAVIGGEGPPLLLVHGWPENWYAWRLVMPQLARDFEVAADDVQTLVIDGSGHWVAEEATEEMLAALRDFLAPYREGGGGLR
jgi:pimeloyl-ACP methyl ester carboxylesterase